MSEDRHHNCCNVLCVITIPTSPSLCLTVSCSAKMNRLVLSRQFVVATRCNSAVATRLASDPARIHRAAAAIHLNAAFPHRTFAKKAGKDKGKSETNAKSSADEKPAVDEKMIKDMLVSGKTKMKDSLDRFEKKLSTIRAGGVDVALIESIMVEVSPGKKVPVSSLGMTSSPTPLKVVVTLNDKDHASAVEKAISSSGLNLQAKKNTDTGVVEIPVPKTTKEQRETRVKLVLEEAEKVKVALRSARQDVIKSLKKLELSEDDTKKNEKQLQTMLDAAVSKVTEYVENKKTELIGGQQKTE